MKKHLLTLAAILFAANISVCNPPKSNQKFDDSSCENFSRFESPSFGYEADFDDLENQFPEKHPDLKEKFRKTVLKISQREAKRNLAK